jgi:hypothetical protein
VAGQLRQPVENIEKYYASDSNAKASLIEQIRSEKAIEFIRQNAKSK